jgi:hypothetical protein
MVLLFLTSHGRLVVAVEKMELRIRSPYHWAGLASGDFAVGFVLAQQVSHGRQLSP